MFNDDIETVISDTFCRYLAVFESGDEDRAKIYQSFLSDLFLLKTGVTQDRDPAGYLAWWSALGEVGVKRRNAKERSQKIENLTRYSESIGFDKDGELEEIPIPDNETITLVVRSDVKAALSVRSEETGETESEIIERLVKAEWLESFNESPTKWHRNFDDIAF